jgi:hypothetical protein
VRAAAQWEASGLRDCRRRQAPAANFPARTSPLSSECSC